MGFINQRQYLELKHRDELRKNPLIGIEDFQDRTDRTLTISREQTTTQAGKIGFRHIFILSGALCLHVYEVDENGEFTSLKMSADGYFPAREVEPTVRRGSAVTDYELAQVMENIHMPISFYVPESSYGQEGLVRDENFFGLTKASWESVEF